MKKIKNNLDEMQEQKLLKIEHNGCWLAFWALLMAIMVQAALGGESVVRNLAGEFVVFMGMCAYLLIDCLRNGIWDRHLKADPKTNLIISVITGLAVGVLNFFISLFNYGSTTNAILTAVIIFVFTFGAYVALLSLSSAIYKRRVRAMESNGSDEEGTV